MLFWGREVGVGAAMEKREKEFFLIMFLVILFCVAFSVGTFRLFVEKLTYIERIGRSISEAGASNDAARSLAATEQMASYADEMAWAASLQAIGSVVSVLLLVGTVVFTIRAAVAAQRSADEAKKANDATREIINHNKATSAVELRPYVTIKEIKTVETDDRCTVVFCFHNFGKSPANNFRTKLWHGLETDLASCKVPPCVPRSSSTITLMPGQEYRISTFEESDENLDSVALELANLLMRIEYGYDSPYYDERVESRLEAYIDQDRLMRGTASVMG